MKNIKYLMIAVIALFCHASFATDIVDVKPLTNKILVVHVDDGYAIHHKRGQARGEESVVVNPLDVVRAMKLTTYTLISSDDSDYSSALNPGDIGRKTKPTEFGLMCQSWDNGCKNNDPDYAAEHWIYLYLPFEMKSGKSYTLNLDNLTAGSNTVNFKFDETALHSETVHVNNVGYAPDSKAKYAYLYHWIGDKGGLDLTAWNGKTFKLYNVDKNEVSFTGTIAFRKDKTTSETGQTTDTPGANFSAADVWECNFSSFTTPGNYKVVVDGIGSSFPFKIDADAYQEAFYWAMKGLYHNRSGIQLKAPYTDFGRPAPHNVKVTPGFAGRLKYSTFRAFDLSNYDGNKDVDKAPVEAGYKGTLENTYGWYQDAGDWDGYYPHSNIPAYLMFLYESGKDKFSDGELNIPESGNGVPDVLDEATWLMRYFKRAKDEIKQKGWGTGGVPGARVFGDLWGDDTKPGDIGQGSWEDVGRDWYVLGEDPWMSYKYAALAAQAAFIFSKNSITDPEGVNWKQEAIDAYAWAKANSKPADETGHDGNDLKHMRLYAAASLYRLTGEDAYHSVFLKEISTVNNLDQNIQDQMFGIWTYLLTANYDRDKTGLESVNTLIGAGADKYLSVTAESRACRWGGDYYFPMLIGQASTPMIQSGVYAYLANKSNAILGQKYLNNIYTTADYYLGANPLNMTWISGVAERSPVGLFHMDWWYRDKADPNNSFPVQPGVVPYGPWRFQDFGPLGWWNPNWAYTDRDGNARIYPTTATDWPGHERWFDMRVSPLSSEFTIHQNTILAAFVYGFLTGGNSTDVYTGLTALPGEQEPPVPVTTGVENKDTDGIKIYPNPTSDTFIVTTKNGQIKQLELFDMNGRRVQNQKNIDKAEYSLDVKAHEIGVYVLKIHLSSKVVTEKRVAIQK